jgi:hypothetical protein
MASKTEGDLLTAVLTSSFTIDADLKYFAQQLAEKHTGKFKFINPDQDQPWNNNICEVLTFTTKLSYYDRKKKEKVPINVTLNVRVSNKPYWGPGRNPNFRQLIIVAIRAGFKDGQHFYEGSDSCYYAGHTSVSYTFKSEKRDEIDLDALFKELTTNVAREIKDAEKRIVDKKIREEKEKERLRKMKEDILASHGFVENEIVNWAYDMIFRSYGWHGKRVVKQQFETYAKLLKGDPYKADESK